MVHLTKKEMLSIELEMEKVSGWRINIFQTEDRIWYNYVCNSYGFSLTRDEFVKQTTNYPETCRVKDKLAYDIFRERTNHTGKSWYKKGE